MMRCPQCGRRVAQVDPICSSHGRMPQRAPAAVSGSGSAVVAGDLQASLAARGYRVTGLLGHGGFGTVYAAERASDMLSVAIKLARNDHASACERLQREEAALRAIGAPHVPSVFDAGEVAEGCFVVMERIAAQTLAARMLELAGPAPLELFHALARAILTPLEAVHKHGLLHCDLKPENIFLDHSGSARLIDFGLVRQLATSSQLVPADDAGTAEYMSPEQCDQLLCDRSSDIYSLGVVFYELLSGSPPFWGLAADVRDAHRSQRPLPLSRKILCPPELDQLVRRCLAKDRERRFEDVAALRVALDQAASSTRVSPISQRARLRQPSGKPTLPKLTAASAPAPAAREKLVMGLVFFESHKGLVRVQNSITSLRGQLVHVRRACYAAAFGQDAGANPTRVALRAAQRILADHVAQRALVDVATVSVFSRPDGSRRILSPVLLKSDRYASGPDATPLMCTSAASEVLPELEFRALSKLPDRFQLAAAQGGGSEDRQSLLGRDEILERLLSSAKRTAETAAPALATVLAPPGYGRTHLAAALAYELSDATRGFDVLLLSAQEGAISQVLPQLLRRVLDVPEAKPDDAKARLLARLGEAGETTWAGVAHALGWIDAEDPDVRRLAAAPGTLRLIAARAASEALQRMAAVKPVALLLDDAHLADEATLDALQQTTAAHTARPIWICVLAPPGFASIRPSWFSQAAAVQHVALPALAPEHAVELARRLLLPAEFIPEAILRKLAERTQGVPNLLVELARGLKRDGFVRRTERGTTHYLATDAFDKLPHLPIVQWNASREIEALPAQLAGHARLASILGSSFGVEEIDALVAQLERDELTDDMQLDPSVGVQRLVASGILVRHRSGLVDFRHAVLREMIYRLIPDAQRTRLHRAALDAYAKLEMPEHLRLPRVAKHAARCGERETAATVYLQLARRCLRAQVYIDAEAAYGGAIENLGEADPRMIEARRGRGLMLARLGRHQDALADLRKARTLAHACAALEQELHIMLDEATALDWVRETQAAMALVHEVAATKTTLTPLLRARLAMSLSRCHFRLGEVDATIRVGNEAVQLAAALGDEGYETRIVAELLVAPNCALAGRLEEAEHGFERLIAEAESRGDARHIAAALANRAFLWLHVGNFERLVADLSRGIQLARELGEAPVEFVSVYNLAETEYVLGRLTAAREHAQRALQLALQHFGELNHEVSSSELLLARIALYEDDLPTAQQLASNVRQRIERGRAKNDADAELEPSAQPLLEMVELSTRAAQPAAWQQLVERSRSVELQPTEAVELLERAALSLAQLAEWSQGRALYQQALQLLRDNPSLIVERVRRKLDHVFGDVA